MGAIGDPPVQTRVVDQDHRVRLLVTEIAIGPEDQTDERDDVEKHVEEPHDRQVDQRIDQLRPGRAHLRSAKADKFGLGEPRAEGFDQVGAMKVAARLAGRDEESHGRVSLPCLTELNGLEPHEAQSRSISP